MSINSKRLLEVKRRHPRTFHPLITKAIIRTCPDPSTALRAHDHGTLHRSPEASLNGSPTTSIGSSSRSNRDLPPIPSEPSTSTLRASTRDTPSSPVSRHASFRGPADEGMPGDHTRRTLRQGSGGGSYDFDDEDPDDRDTTAVTHQLAASHLTSSQSSSIPPAHEPLEDTSMMNTVVLPILASVRLPVYLGLRISSSLFVA